MVYYIGPMILGTLEGPGRASTALLLTHAGRKHVTKLTRHDERTALPKEPNLWLD